MGNPFTTPSISVDDYIDMFHEAYPYIAVNNDVLGQFFTDFPTHKRDNTKMVLDYARDYVLSQGLEDEVEL